MKFAHTKRSNRNYFYSGSLKSTPLSSNTKYQYFLIMLLLFDAFFIYASWSYPSNSFTNDAFDITKELGYSELFQHVKEFTIALILFKVFIKTKDTIFFVWSLFFTYLLLDDSFQIHEIVGNTIASNLISKSPHFFNLRGQDLGELMISALVGSMFLLLFIRHFYGSTQAIKKISYNLIVLVIFLLFCGIFIDMVHSALPNVAGFTTFEDGGEMIVMSVICWYVYNVLKHGQDVVFSLVNQSSIKYANSIFDYLYDLFEHLHLTVKKIFKRE